MSILQRFTLRNLRLNWKRTCATIIGIMLATALIVAVADMAESFRASMVEYERETSGDYHYHFYQVSSEDVGYFEENVDLERVGYAADIGYTRLEDSRNADKPYLYLQALNTGAMQAYSIHVTEGRLPENGHEILVSDTVRTNGGVSLEVGDTIELSNGVRVDESGAVCGQSSEYLDTEQYQAGDETQTYTIVGFMERLNTDLEPYTAPGYTVITYMEDPTAYATLDIYATYTKQGLKQRDAVTAGLLGVSLDAYQSWKTGGDLTDEEAAQLAQTRLVSENSSLLRYQLLLFSDETLQVLYGMAAMAGVIIMITSVFCIRNSFVISLTEKMKLYGMLASIGATGGQRRRLVRQEAFFLGCAGISLGVGLGLLVSWLLVRITTSLLRESLNLDLMFRVSVPAILVGVLLSAVTVFFSSGQAARKATKVSPILAIRGNETIRNPKRKIRMPRLLEKLFGVGGKIAYKNLKRAKVRYRTTVISIVVSVAIFIGMSGFMNLCFRVSRLYYREVAYQLSVSIDGDRYADDIQRLRGLDGVTYMEAEQYGDSLCIPVSELQYADTYRQHGGVPENAEEAYEYIPIVSLDAEAFAQYCGTVGCQVTDETTQGILIGDCMELVEENGKTKGIQGEKFDYQPGDVLTGNVNEAGAASASVSLAAQTTERPLGLKSSTNTYLVVSENWVAAHPEVSSDYSYSVFFQCEDADALEAEILDVLGRVDDYSIYNVRQSYEQTRSIYVLIAIFLYGFIGVIALIGITNVFNTITTNMELRAREFATLKSIGMTSKEFRRMVRLESLFYGSKALLIAIPIGLALSVGFYKIIISGEQIELSYELPYAGLLISIAAVFLLLFGIMRYSMGKINRQNLIETIQNENV